MALDCPEDAELRVNEAHELAIKAATTIADAEPQPSGRIRTVLGLPRKHRPGSVRVSTHNRVSALGVTLVRADTYYSTGKARRTEQELCDIDRYISVLRAVRVSSFGQNDDAIPRFRVRLVPSYNVPSTNVGVPGVTGVLPLLGSSSELYALQYQEVNDTHAAGENEEGVQLGLKRPRWKLTFVPSWRTELSLRSQFPFMRVVHKSNMNQPKD
jgi:hypothetical protein